MKNSSSKKWEFILVWMLLVCCISGTFQVYGYADTMDLHTVCIGLQSRRHGSNNLPGEPIAYRLTGGNVDTGVVNTYARAEDLAGVLGCFETIHLTYGQYTIQFMEDSMTDYLSISETFNVASNNKTIIDIELIEGDANGDNLIDDSDYQIIASSYTHGSLVCEGDSNYDYRADFNEDRCVSELDYGLWLANIGLNSTIQVNNSLLTNRSLGEVPLAVDVNTAVTHTPTIPLLLIIAASMLALYTMHLLKPKTTLTP